VTAQLSGRHTRRPGPGKARSSDGDGDGDRTLLMAWLETPSVYGAVSIAVIEQNVSR
jgi:hypothetical protein